MRIRSSRPPSHCTRRGSAPLTLALWLVALLLFVAPFLGERDTADDTSAEGWVDWPREANNEKEEGPYDTPFATDLRWFEEDYETDLSGPLLDASDAWFGLDSARLRESGLIDVARVESGERAYQTHCGGCHGTEGDGGGPAARYLNPRPRNFRRGVFKFTSTASNQRPTRADLFSTITRGLEGSSMPDFRLLSEELRHDLSEYVRYLALRGEFEQLALDLSWDEEEPADLEEAFEIVTDNWKRSDAVYPAAPETPFDAESVARGREVYLDAGRANCAACHGDEGLGDGPSATAFEDGWGYRVQPRDLTTGVFRAGTTSADLYRSIASGINGTPMPAFGGSLTPEEIWDVVHYVQSLGGNR